MICGFYELSAVKSKSYPTAIILHAQLTDILVVMKIKIIHCPVLIIVAY